MRRALRAILLAACLAGGCNAGTIEISSAPMAGLIGGVAWSFGTAETNALLSRSDQLWIDVYQEALAPCTGAGASVSSNRLILNAPTQAGDYLLGSGVRVTFYVPMTGNNYVATQGRMVIDQVTDTMLSGGANLRYDDSNDVDGQFQATICPP